MTDEIRAAAIALYDRFTHEGMDRRAFMAEMSRIAGGTAAAGALLTAIAADPAAAAIVPAGNPRIATSEIAWQTGPRRAMKGYLAAPAAADAHRRPVVVIHENRGLNDHIRDVARRLAVVGYLALAPDFLSSAGGTPADPDKAREMIGALEMPVAVSDGVATLASLQRHPQARGNVGVIGFCWGGAMVNRLSVAAGPALGAAISFYGPAPDPSEATRVEAPVMLHLAGLDERVNKTALPWAEALKDSGKRVELHLYQGVNHAFHNDSSAERFDAAAAKLAWERSLAFLEAHTGPVPVHSL